MTGTTLTQPTCATCGAPIHWNSQDYVSAHWVHNTIADTWACPAEDVTPA